MVEHAALVKILIDKGLFTETEYIKAISEAMEAEVCSYEQDLSRHYGRPVKLL